MGIASLLVVAGLVTCIFSPYLNISLALNIFPFLSHANGVHQRSMVKPLI